MAKNVDGKVDRIESAANIVLIISVGGATSAADQQDTTTATGEGSTAEAKKVEVPISRLDTTKDVEITEVRESSLKASGYSITAISYSGTMMFKGSRLTKNLEGDKQVYLDDLLYDDHGVPKAVSINITHDLNEESEMYQHVLVTSESYEVRSEEVTETAYDWVAMDRKSDQSDA